MLTIACLIALGWWGWSWVEDNVIGNADGRIHVYNSEVGWPVSLEIRRLDAEEPARVVSLASGEGYTYRAIHPGTYVVDVVAPEHLQRRPLRVEVPRRDDDFIDLLLDIGGRGDFYLVPVFYLPGDLSDEDKRDEVARLETAYPEYAIGPATHHPLPVRVDYGLHESAPFVQGGAMPSRPSLRSFPRRFLASLVEDTLGYDEQEAYYVLVERGSYGRVPRVGTSW